jgi:polyhydroxyalkanoate synthesis regulator phasin
VNQVFESHRQRITLTLALLMTLSLLGAVPALAENATPGQHPQVKMQQTFLTKLAAELGIGEAKLQAALQTAARKTVDEASKTGLITRERAQKFQDAISKGKWWVAAKPGHQGSMVKKGGFVDDAAHILGITPQELRDQLKSGRTLQQVATAKGLTLEQLKTKWLGQKKADLDKLVKDGRLTPVKAQGIYSQLEKVDFSKAGN